MGMRFFSTPTLRYISIHAPVKGATLQTFPHGAEHFDFNPRTREGCDVILPTVVCSIGLNFNPRTREGCDTPKFQCEDDAAQISIHAPVKGATRCHAVGWNVFLRISIHAPVKGATSHCQLSKRFPALISIHAPVKGATHAPTEPEQSI